MNDPLLLDSHILLWLDRDLEGYLAANKRLAEGIATRNLWISDISVWELGVALHKKNLERRPDLRGLSLDAWFKDLAQRLGAHQVRVTRAIAVEAGEVPGVYGSGDPGDCFLIATARVRRLTLATRDREILRLAAREPEYLRVVAC